MVFVGLGLCTHELIGVVDRLPPIGTSQEFRQFSVQGSGTCANAMACLARWKETSRFVGKVGDDSRGMEMVAALDAEGVDTSFTVRQKDSVSQIRWVLGESKGRGFRTFYTDGSVGDLTTDEVDIEAAFGDADVVLLDSQFPKVATEVAKFAKKDNKYVLFYADDLGTQHLELLTIADHIIASERTAGRFARHSKLEAICNEFLNRGPCRVTVTIGPEGVAGKEVDAEFIQRPAVPVDFVDPLGANGAFFGASAYAVAAGMSFEETLNFANVAAALSCRGFGPRTEIPTLDEIHARCEEL